MAAAVHGEPTAFNLAPQSADRALLALSKQARIEILFSYDELRQARSNAVTGSYEPAQALEILLRGTGFTARQTGESKWVVSPTGPPKGSIKGKVLAPDGSPARRVRVTLTPLGHTVASNESGAFELRDIPPGLYGVVLNAQGFRPTQLTNVDVSASQTVMLETQTLQPAEDPARLEPYVVQARGTYSLDHSDAHFAQQNASGNLDLSRTETDALPYMIFNRSQIARSGVVNLNEFLQRELIDSTADTLPPEQNGALKSYTVGSSNLKLRGFTSDETVILVNGRRLPEVLTSEQGVLPPDVNFIPLSLVQQVEVLPVSASALYSGNAVGGVINIVLRPDVDANASEVSATYTNALGRFDAPQSSLSLVHAESLLSGKLRFRLNATFARTTPPTEAELGYRQRRYSAPTDLDTPLYRATPAIRSVRPELTFAPGANAGVYATFPESASGTVPALLPLPALSRLGSSPVTSVAPGSDGTRGLAGFEGRSGVRNLALFDSPGAFSTSIDSLDYPYGREQQRTTYYGSVAYDVLPWLQLAFDGTRSSTVVHRGLDVLPVDLLLPRDSALNPFGQDVRVSLNETAPALGENYNEARLEFGSAVLGAAIKLPDDWRVMLDLQYSHNLVKYRGLAGASADRWQQLVDAGLYNPLRDTQQYGPPRQFYDEVLIYRGSRGRFVTLGNYETVDAALRVRNESLHLPTGPGIVNAGADFRRNQMAGFTDQQRFGDGSLAGEPLRWDPRMLDRYSFFGELQAPVVPSAKLPRWLHAADADLAGRYVASSSSRESNFAPTLGLRLAFPLGFTFRGSVTTSTRFPTPSMSRLHVAPSTEPGTINANQQPIFDPVRKETYNASIEEDMDPDLDAESAVTQTAGLIFQRGQTHRFRAAIDFVDTRKSNELFPLDKDQVVANESLWPERVRRAAAAPGAPAGRIVSVLTGRANLWERHSQDFTASLDYRWNGCLGGTLEAYVRGLYFHRYTVRTLPSMPPVDELHAPDGLVNILKYRANFGATWSNKTYAAGWDGHYFHSRLLPRSEWLAQGHDSIRPFWQFDTFVQSDLAQWLPWKSTRYGLRGQVRVNNVFATGFPKYVNDQYGAGVQPYGDWRGRMYSVSLTATF